MDEKKPKNKGASGVEKSFHHSVVKNIFSGESSVLVKDNETGVFDTSVEVISKKFPSDEDIAHT
ncbi:hypothetical protein ACJIZ3_006046 [Penstemon smallii]|uniref:Uncharacterized protein n=1 Tax=Penstemon smallii TaxID=265156 RepID=A0ABD3S6R4_9LAMI